MSAPIVPLFTRNLRTWLGARGFWMVAFAALLPLVLTGAWVGSHQADLTIPSFTMDREEVRAGEHVNFTAVVRNDGILAAGSFNVTIGVFVVQNDLSFVANPAQGGKSQSFRIEGLAPGESREVTMNWFASPGVFLFLASADKPSGSQPETGDVPEIEELNNFAVLRSADTTSGVQVIFPRATPGPAPSVPEPLGGNATAANSTDLRVALSPVPASAAPGGHVNITATVTNDGPDNALVGRLFLRVGPVGADGNVSATAVNRPSRLITLQPGESATLNLTWNVPSPGTFWVQAYARPGPDSSDPDTSNNVVASAVTVNPTIPANIDQILKEQLDPLTEVPEQATIRSFYRDILALLHLRILIPFIALFYAAGVIADEREKGNLAYLLTRPVERWLIPLSKFFASFLVAALAILVGVAGTYGLLFGAVPEAQDIGFLSTPLLATLVALFVYGAFFVLLGVLVERPYLVGVAFVIGWETIAGNFVEWVSDLTIQGNLSKAFAEWDLDKGLQWWPDDGAAATHLRNVLIAAVAFLVLASVLMKRREFEV